MENHEISVSNRKGILRGQLKALTAFFPEDCLTWIPRATGSSQDGICWVLLLPYINRTAVLDRLDEVCGPENWQDEYEKGPSGGLICRLSILIEGTWISKCGGAENIGREAVKGGITEALKRAASKWGIGRYLASIPHVRGIIDNKGQFSCSYPLYPKNNQQPIYFRYNIPRLNAFWLPKEESKEVIEIRSNVEGYIHLLSEKAQSFFKEKLSRPVSLLEMMRIATALENALESARKEKEQNSAQVMATSPPPSEEPPQQEPAAPEDQSHADDDAYI
jgi:hypothetical protein